MIVLLIDARGKRNVANYGTKKHPLHASAVTGVLAFLSLSGIIPHAAGSAGSGTRPNALRRAVRYSTRKRPSRRRSDPVEWWVIAALRRGRCLDGLHSPTGCGRWGLPGTVVSPRAQNWAKIPWRRSANPFSRRPGRAAGMYKIDVPHRLMERRACARATLPAATRAAHSVWRIVAGNGNGLASRSQCQSRGTPAGRLFWCGLSRSISAGGMRVVWQAGRLHHKEC
jgi:hypothetical protein